MAVGYPIIMGLILSLGAIIPALLQSPGELVSLAGLLLLAGMAVTVGGIVLCSRAAASKDAEVRRWSETASPAALTHRATDRGARRGLLLFSERGHELRGELEIRRGPTGRFGKHGRECRLGADSSRPVPCSTSPTASG